MIPAAQVRATRSTPESEAGAVQPKMRKSCEFCHYRKRKCDGDGVNPCSLCISKRRETCVYSTRRPHRSHPRFTVESSDRERSGEDSRERSCPGQAGGKRGDTASLKRCHLSASPATGLVGTRENAYLSSFFGCMGFLPLACPSAIRSAMLSILFSWKPEHPRAGGEDGAVEDSGGRRRLSGSRLEAEGSRKGRASMDASVCLFWCVLALGALVEGTPLVRVKPYVRLAEAALRQCKTRKTLDLARVHAAMFYVCSFYKPNMEDSIAHLQEAGAIVRELHAEGSEDDVPEAFAEMVHLADKSRLCYGRWQEDSYAARIQSFCSRNIVRLQVGTIFTKERIARFVHHLQHRMAQAFYKCVMQQVLDGSTIAPGDPGDGERLDPSRRDGESPGGLTGGHEPHVNPACEGTERGGFNRHTLRQFFEEIEVEFLSAVAEMSEFRKGMGALIVNNCLVAIKIAEGDAWGASVVANRCIETFVHYPGLCHSSVGFHLIHVLSLMLMVVKDKEGYQKLRALYNVWRPRGLLPLPSMEKRMEPPRVCEDAMCRFMEEIVQRDHFASFISVFKTSRPGHPTPVDGSSVDEQTECAGREAWGEHPESAAIEKYAFQAAEHMYAAAELFTDDDVDAESLIPLVDSSEGESPAASFQSSHRPGALTPEAGGTSSTAIFEDYGSLETMSTGDGVEEGDSPTSSEEAGRCRREGVEGPGHTGEGDRFERSSVGEEPLIAEDWLGAADAFAS